jgi:hypothetical protein
VNRCNAADGAELRRRLWLRDVFEDTLNDMWAGDIGNGAQLTAACAAL